MGLRFADLLGIHLRHRRWSVNEFAAKVGLGQPTVWRVETARRPPDLDWLEPWADALELTGSERDDFILAGMLAHCPAPIVEMIERHDADLAALTQQVAELRAIISQQERQIVAILRPPPPAPAAG